MSDPRRFDEGEATEFERQLFEAAKQHTPDAALKARMREGLGLAAPPSAAAPAAGKTLALSGKSGVLLGLVAIAASVTVPLIVRTRARPTSSETAPAVPKTLPGGQQGSRAADDPAQARTRAAASAAASVADEILLIDRARGALSAGDHRRALEVLEQYGQRYPRGKLGPEAVVVRVEALDAAGDTPSARALGQQFLAQHPNNPLADRVAKIVSR